MPRRKEPTIPDALLDQLLAGADLATAARIAKQTASFSGPMRANLIAMLDHFRVNRVLGVPSCAELFGAGAKLVHYTSALRYPVFVDGDNYGGTPPMTANPLLRRQLMAWFAEEARALPHALFVPLGGKVSDAVRLLAREGIIDPERVLDGLQHPSGANAERIAYLIGRKPRDRLSPKTNAATIDAAREFLSARIEQLLAA
jgi:hypothetical protein